MANLAEPLRLTLVAPRAGNPGELRMMTYVPPGLPPGAPLVVVLHGCTQNAAAYDHGSGWSELAERHGFALLFPEQTRGNNPNLCFNWFQPDDTTRGRGEAESIRLMVGQMLDTYHLDPRRVFITGLSAGGAMTSTMLATAPELFAGAAIIAGLPYGAAQSMSEAFAVMGHGRQRAPRDWGDLVRNASNYTGPRAAVQIWHGTSDGTVGYGNADELVLQWTDVLGLPWRPTEVEQVDGARHETWSRADGHIALERWTLADFGHGTPISALGTDTDRTVGVPGPHMLNSSVNSTFHIARRWGLLTQAARTRTASRTQAPPQEGSVVERALRAAGLLR